MKPLGGSRAPPSIGRTRVKLVKSMTHLARRTRKRLSDVARHKRGDHWVETGRQAA